MRKSTASELKMLREIVRDLLPRMNCCFCHEPLIEDDPDFRFGDRNAAPIRERLTGHHKDRNHANNALPNRKWAHTICHRRYHAKVERWRPQDLKASKA